MSTAEFETLLAYLGSRQALVELAALGSSFLMAWLVARTIRNRLPGKLQPGARKFGAGSVHRLSFPFFALGIVWLSKTLLVKFQSVALLKIAIPLLLSFVVIRFAIYLLRHLMPPSPSLKASERILAYSVWLLVALHITGILPELASALDEVKFTVGKQKLTLLMIINGLLSAALTIFVSLSLSSIIEKHLMGLSSLDKSSRVFAAKLLRAVVFLVAVLVALSLVGIDITILSVFGGALGVGLGLGMQKIASNYVSGFVILLDRSIKPGDLVTVNDRHGIIADIKSRYTVLKALDGTESIIPNDTIITTTVINHSYSDRRVLVKVQVAVAYNTDLEKALQIMQNAARLQPRVLVEPEPGASITALGENGIELELGCWIEDADLGQGQLRSEILMKIWADFQTAGIQVPFPQREVRVISNPENQLPQRE